MNQQFAGFTLHIHNFEGATSVDLGHSHNYAGETNPAPNVDQHIHLYNTTTSIDANHDHRVEGTTGPAIRLPDGGHTHILDSVTTVNGSTPHKHNYSQYTGRDYFKA